MCIFIYCLYVHCPLQPFKPGYTAPPPMFQIGRIPVNFRYFLSILSPNPGFFTFIADVFLWLVSDVHIYLWTETLNFFACGCFIRGNWEISRRDLNNSRFIAVVSPDRNFIDPESDEYAASTARSEFCCRSVAIIVISLSLSREVCHRLVCMCFSTPIII